MTTKLAERLKAARSHSFVGRADELALFESAITAAELPFCVLYIFGPGGVGKTALARTFVSHCSPSVPAIYLDARDIEPSPASFGQAIQDALPPSIESLESHGSRMAIIIDTYESLASLDDWLRDEWLPRLSDQVLVVLAGRNPPSSAWRADPGWQELLRVVSLRNLSPDESLRFLEQRALPSAQHQPVIDWTHGHPLALSLVADVFAQRRDAQFQPDDVPDVIQTLLERLVQKVPGPAHRTVLEACALVRVTSEALLAEMLGATEVHELFEWLRGLSFIESGPRGLFPHDLAREALIADLRWRNPDWFAELHRRARTYYARALQQQAGHDQQRVMFDYVYLHRDNPFVRPFLEWQESGSGIADTMTHDDVPELLRIVAAHEGAESARLAAHWIERQPQNVTVYRDATQRPAGLLIRVDLEEAAPRDIAADPASAAAWSFLQRHTPLRTGDCASIFRFWMARDSYQAVSAAQSLIFVNIAQFYINTPGLAYTFFTCADPAFWAPAFAYMDLALIEDAAFTVAERRYGVYGHDWRVVPPLAWLDLLAERELSATPLARRPATATSLVVLSQPAFEDAVRDALHDLARPDSLRSNPLLRSRLVLDRAGAQASEAARINELQSLLRRAAESLQATPREAKWYRALYHTYIQPAATQEQASELLDVPFSTYRRHLKSAVERLTELLWQWELQGAAS
jgi:hypothetical protein